MRHVQPLSPKINQMLHGGDYNPDQWLDRPDIIDQDFRCMEKTGCNAMSIGIFSWTALEPQEGRFTFDWLDGIMDRLAKINAYAVLATPSGARPAWMAQKYPEVLRVSADRRRNLYGVRHNHCFTSPLYRDKVAAINRKLAQRYKDHPALLMWHLSNEYSGECHCPLCQDAFRAWLRTKYNDSLDALNKSWWTSFWSHLYTDWSQIESPAPHGEPLVHGLNLDWKRFVTDQTTSFIRNEIAPLREITPVIPVTTNFMGTYQGLDYWKVQEPLDCISWDSYPQWHRAGDAEFDEPSFQAFIHDMCRAFKKGKPFMLMESTPSMTNWQQVPTLKRPGMHVLSSLLAIAHGSDTVQYFQWRKSQGSCEKFHGAVLDHCGNENSRVFKDVADVGALLKKLAPVVGSTTQASVALMYDWENNWAMDDAKCLGGKQEYASTCHQHYKPFWKKGVAVDVINEDQDLGTYRMLVVPMLYMVRKGVGERIDEFVRNGGILVATYWSGIVDEHDLCFDTGFPGPLRKTLGIFDEEIDTIWNTDVNQLVVSSSLLPGLQGSYAIKDLCALIHAESATILGTYGSDFYKGRPALTMNSHGKGTAYYIAARTENRFLADFYGALIAKHGLPQCLDATLPDGVICTQRTDGEKTFLFVMNFNESARTVEMTGGKPVAMSKCVLEKGKLNLEGYGVAVLER